MEELLAAEGTSVEEMVRQEHQRQATMNVTVRNVITSMRLISWFDWAEFVESVSLVDDVLRAQAPFTGMDFATRDRYRHAVEVLARRSGLAEVEVARMAVEMAAGPTSDGPAAAGGPDPGLAGPHREPGFYLISDGRPAFERALNVRVPWASRLRRAYVRAGAAGYLGTFVAVTAFLLAVPLLLGALAGGAAGAGIVAIAILALGPTADLAMALVNHGVTNVLGPKALPRLDLDEGVPTSLRTLVVVPMLLTGEADVEAQVNGLEVHYLGNREGDIRFALLSDWLDAPTEHVPGDDELFSAAAAAVDRLNERHG
jgi:cyclic beta-1,2-glucan synthetase